MDGFHVKDGLYFKRNPDGLITICFQTTIDTNSFASIMASMSARGETAGVFDEAFDLITRAPK